MGLVWLVAPRGFAGLLKELCFVLALGANTTCEVAVCPQSPLLHRCQILHVDFLEFLWSVFL